MIVQAMQLLQLLSLQPELHAALMPQSPAIYTSFLLLKLLLVLIILLVTGGFVLVCEMKTTA